MRSGLSGTAPSVARALALSLALAPLTTACGAKTGLDAPDGAVDATVPFDAALPPDLCIEVPPDGSPVLVDITVPVSLAVVDVHFLIDGTASMVDEIDNVRERLRDLVVPGVRRAIPDAAFGLSFLGEFPVDPHGPDDVRPYERRSFITTDVRTIEAELDRNPSWGNFDDPEAQVEALYQVATGEGLAPWIVPSLGCPSGGTGGVCFRTDSLPIVMLITDAPFHNGPGGAEPYEFDGPHNYADAIRELTRLGIVVVGLGATDTGRPSAMPDLRSVACDTGAVSESSSERPCPGRTERPLAFDIGSRGEDVGESIVSAVQRVAEGLPLDVDAIVQDRPGDDIDARLLVRAIRPRSAEPPSGAREVTPEAFLGVTPGTRVTFEVEVDASSLPASDSTRRIGARIIFRAFGRSRLGQEDVVIVVPGADGGGCEAE